MAWLGWLVDAPTDERNWRVGAQGEREVGKRLDRLRSKGWRVLHSIPVGTHGSDIDHLVIGPGGVFAINTKTHRGARVWVHTNVVKVNGANQPYVRNSRFEADRATRFLSRACGFEVGVRAALVLVGCELSIKQQPNGVGVLSRSQVPSWFRRQRAVVPDWQVEAIYDTARWADNWR